MSRTAQELLLQLRALHERLARRDLGQAVRTAAQADEYVGRARRALADSMIPDHGTPEQFIASVAARNSLSTLLTASRERAVLAHAQVQVAAGTWGARERDREAAEHLVDAEKERRDAERAAGEQRESDDLSSARHGRDDDGGRS
jgi:hypothetical protein